jgi:hypothetical protein
MTGLEIKEFAEGLLDNNVDWSDDHFYRLLNIAKTKLEEGRLWQYLKKSTILTSSSLPDDCAEDYKVLVGTGTEYFPVPFEEQYFYTNSSNRYYIDWANLTINFLGTVGAGSRYFFYKRFTPDIEEGTSPVFPTRFHPLLAYYVVAIHQTGTDSDDIFARMGPANKQAAIELERAMKSWDTSIAMRAQNNQVGVANTTSEVPIEQM